MINQASRSIRLYRSRPSILRVYIGNILVTRVNEKVIILGGGYSGKAKRAVDADVIGSFGPLSSVPKFSVPFDRETDAAKSRKWGPHSWQTLWLDENTLTPGRS